MFALPYIYTDGNDEDALQAAAAQTRLVEEARVAAEAEAAIVAA